MQGAILPHSIAEAACPVLPTHALPHPPTNTFLLATKQGWIDGVAIMMAVVIVATVTATNDYNKQLQFRALSAESQARVEVQVIRGGTRYIVGTQEVGVWERGKVSQLPS